MQQNNREAGLVTNFKAGGSILVWDETASQRVVLNEGFAWKRTTYRSLTEIALPWASTRWSGAAARNRPSVREPEHQVLARPRDRRVEQAGDADPVWQSTFDGGLDEARRQEGQRDRHVDVALAAGLPCTRTKLVTAIARGRPARA